MDNASCIYEDNPFLMVVKSSQIVDLSVRGNNSVGHLTPIVDLKIGKSIDYDDKQVQYFFISGYAPRGPSLSTLNKNKF